MTTTEMPPVAAEAPAVPDLLFAAEATIDLLAIKPEDACAVIEEMKLLPVLEHASLPFPLPGLEEWTVLSLPSGHVITYRHLTDDEKKIRDMSANYVVLISGVFAPGELTRGL
jgi:hypothetical protein